MQFLENAGMLNVNIHKYIYYIDLYSNKLSFSPHFSLKRNFKSAMSPHTLKSFEALV